MRRSVHQTVEQELRSLVGLLDLTDCKVCRRCGAVMSPCADCGELWRGACPECGGRMVLLVRR